MSEDERLLVAAFPSELPRGTGWPTSICGSRAAWSEGPPTLPGSGPLLITGSCGALLPGHEAGSLVLPQRLLTTAGAWLSPDPELRAGLLRLARETGCPVDEGGIAELAEVVDAPADRAELAATTSCGFVDLESASLALVAEVSGRPWAVLRFVSDGPERSLGWLEELYGGFPASEPGVLQTLAALARHPGQSFRLIALGRGVARGRRAVARLLAGGPV